MVVALKINVNDTLELEEFCEIIDKEFDLSDREQFLAAAPTLMRLANNKTLFRNLVLETLQRAVRGHALGLAPAYFVLHMSKPGGFIVRANLWPPMRPGAPRETRDLFSYDLKHDHTFTFLTANYFGPGYETDVWLNPTFSDVQLQIGAVVPLVYQGRFTLDQGTMLYFQRGLDVHVQNPPKTDSVSINLIYNDPEEARLPQHFYAFDSGTILGYPVGSPVHMKLAFAHLLSLSDDEGTIDVLDWAAKKISCPVLREATMVARGRLESRLRG